MLLMKSDFFFAYDGSYCKLFTPKCMSFLNHNIFVHYSAALIAMSLIKICCFQCLFKFYELCVLFYVFFVVSIII